MKRRAFTLLELLLALGLTVIVVGAMTTAIHQYLLFLTRQQQEIERKQIARGVVRMIGEDLRAAIQYKPQDYTGLENLIASQSLSGLGGLATGVDEENIDADQLEDDILDAVAGGGGGDTQGGGTAGGGTSGGGTSGGGTGMAGGGGSAAGESGSSSSMDEESAQDEEEEEVEDVPGRPTMIGIEAIVRIDTSRLPRLDEYNPLVARKSSEDHLPSDVKTVSYFFSQAAPTSKDPLSKDFGKNGGLYRRQVDRAVEAYRGEAEVSPYPDKFSDLVSPEVSAIQFRYWDGEQWQSNWDSEENDGFPLAIEVQLVIDPERASTETAVTSQLEDQREIYRTVVHLPVAEIIPEEEAEDAGQASDEAGSGEGR